MSMPGRWLLAAAAVSALAAPVSAQTYTFAKVVDDSGPLSAFLQPSVNSAGQVAFWGLADDGKTGVYAGTAGGSVAPVALTSAGGFTGFGYNPIINGSGQVAFYACSGCGETAATGVYTAPAGVPSPMPAPVATTAGPGFAEFGDPSVNASGLVAFQADLKSGGQGVYVVQTGNPDQEPVAVAATSPGGFTGFSQFVSVNAAGQVAFVAQSTAGAGPDAREVTGVYVGQAGTTPGTVASTEGGFTGFGDAAAVNGSGQVAFVARTAAGEGVYVGTAGGTLAEIATTVPVPAAPPGDGFYGFGSVAINDAGRAAFLADLAGGERGIYAGTAAGTALVVRTGGDLDGRTVDNLFFGPAGLASDGRVAFVAVFTDGTSGVYVADLAPVPEPGAAALVATAGLGLARLARRRPGRSNPGR